ncbi:jg10928 [Pararge aegeria aegeria]|uniref:Jg10928 protein n=1 Tax=Pararge aegeria aegeria TaxID=348720 RepID=A0A8S4SG83_9NEOP|nr:jg10928 [Pararge aegeria aegeria]
MSRRDRLGVSMGLIKLPYSLTGELATVLDCIITYYQTINETDFTIAPVRIHTREFSCISGGQMCDFEDVDTDSSKISRREDNVFMSDRLAPGILR